MHSGGPLASQWCPLLKKSMARTALRCAGFYVVVLFLAAADAVLGEHEQSATLTPIPGSSTTEKHAAMKGEVPQTILELILKEAAALSKVDRAQLVIARAQSVVWNDGSLGCPEPGMEYTQALVNGYWIIIEAAGKKYDFRVGSGGSFRLCPPGQGQPPSQPAAN